MAQKQKTGLPVLYDPGETNLPDVRFLLEQIPTIADFISQLVAAPDKSEASALIREQAGHVFDMVRGEDIRRLETELATIEKQADQSQKAMEDHHRQLTNTSPTIKSAAYFRQDDQVSLFSEKLVMPLKDKIVAGFCLFFGAIVVLLGAGNVYSTVMAAGIPVFLDNPFLAGLIAALVPLGSIALKFFVFYLPHDRARRIYSYVIYAAAAASLMAWIVQFALTFGAASSGVDWNSFGEGSGESGDNNASFVIVQLLADIFIGATLFLVAGDMYEMYEPTTRFHNPAYQELNRMLRSLREDHEELSARVIDLKSRLEPLRAARNAYINAQLALYLKRAAQFADTSR